MAFGRWLQDRWYASRPAPVLWLLFPLTLLFGLLAGLRRLAFRRGWLASVRLPVPVVVVGNLTVGGAGKTPLTLWLVEALAARGYRPGIISRGYGGSHMGPTPVEPGAEPGLVGDEPLLLAARSGVPVWVGRDRAAAGAALLAAHPEVDLLVCDDGLQHYRLQRDVELAVFDGRGAGNGCLMPMGPLREPLSRLTGVQAVVFNGRLNPELVGRLPSLPTFAMQLEAAAFYRLGEPGRRCAPGELRGRRLHGVAGIGDPDRFFRTLAGLGLEFEPHPFPDHHAYRAGDLAFAGDDVILMTEKDGVKCARLDLGEAWVLPVAARLPPELIDVLLERLNGRKAP